MTHSSSKLEKLDISSCRHIERDAFEEVWDGKKRYPMLREVNLSFLTRIDTSVMAGLFRSAPSLRKVTAFGCFDVVGVVVPKGVALIGVPNALEAIVQEGGEGEWARSML